MATFNPSGPLSAPKASDYQKNNNPPIFGGGRAQKFQDLAISVAETQTKLTQQQECLKGFEKRNTKCLNQVLANQDQALSQLNELMKKAITKQKIKELSFLEGVGVIAQAENQKRISLMQDVVSTLEVLMACSVWSAELKEKVQTVQFKQTTLGEDGKEVVVYPQHTMNSKLNEHIHILEKVLCAVPIIQKKIKKTLEKLTPFYNTLTEAQKNYRNEITKRGNEILLTANRLAFERDLLQDTLNLLPQVKYTSKLIAESKSSISAKKDDYQAVATSYSGDDWSKVENYFKAEQETFKKYNAETVDQEKALMNLKDALVSVKTDPNSLGAFFAHDEKIREQNQSNWDAMISLISKERTNLRTTLINQWKALYFDLDFYSQDIAHIGDAVQRKSFISKSRMLYASYAVGNHAKVEIANPASLK